jgi:hypothetical protein
MVVSYNDYNYCGFNYNCLRKKKSTTKPIKDLELETRICISNSNMGEKIFYVKQISKCFKIIFILLFLLSLLIAIFAISNYLFKGLQLLYIYIYIYIYIYRVAAWFLANIFWGIPHEI